MLPENSIGSSLNPKAVARRLARPARLARSPAAVAASFRAGEVETMALDPPAGPCGIQDEAGRSAKGARAAGGPRIQHPGQRLAVRHQPMAMTVNDGAGLGVLVAQSLVASGRRRSVPVHNHQTAAGQFHGRLLWQLFQQPPLVLGPLARHIIVAAHRIDATGAGCSRARMPALPMSPPCTAISNRAPGRRCGGRAVHGYRPGWLPESCHTSDARRSAIVGCIMARRLDRWSGPICPWCRRPRGSVGLRGTGQREGLADVDL